MMNTWKSLFIAIAIAVLLPFNVSAQDSIAEPFQLLTTVTVTAKRTTIGTSAISAFSVGSPAMVSDSATLTRLSEQSLSTLITTTTPAFVRENAASMATMHLRGTGAVHTSVVWNGVNITSASMGQMNLKHLPVFFLDDVQVHAGGEGALYGSGSIGGNLELNTKASTMEGLGIVFQQSVASFGSTFTGAKVNFGKKSWQSKTCVLYSKADNDFPFKNPATYQASIQRQQNAGYYSGGVQQEFYIKLGKNTNLSSQTRLMKIMSEIQPLMVDTANVKDRIVDELAHTLLTLNHHAQLAHLTVIGGYLYDYQEPKIEDSKIKISTFATHRIVGIVEAERQLLKPLRVRLGFSSDYIIPDMPTYRNDTAEWRRDVYAHMLLTPTSRLDVSVNLRQSFVSNRSVPFTPAVGLAYQVVKSDNQTLRLFAGASRNVRVPTLNERNWGDTDTTKLQSEVSTNVELGVDYLLTCQPALTIKSGISAYRNKVDNWIHWIPRGHIWKPLNYQKVNSSGIEVAISISSLLANIQLHGGGTYAYTPSTIEEGATKDDPRKGMQLTYQPIHRATAFANVGYKGYLLGCELSYVGDRRGTDVNYVQEAYLLTNLLAEKRLTFGRNIFVLNARIENLFDVDYQNIRFFAMPGRSWQVGIRYQLNPQPTEKHP